MKKCKSPKICDICSVTVEKGDWMLQDPEGEWQHYECVLAKRDQIEAAAGPMSDISEEEFGFLCPTCSTINTMEDAVCSGCGQDLSTLDIEEDGEDRTAPSEVPVQPSTEAATSVMRWTEETKFQLEHAREYLGQKKVPTSWAGLEEMAPIFQLDLEEMRHHQSFQEIRKTFQDYYDNLKNLEASHRAILSVGADASTSGARPTSSSASAPRPRPTSSSDAPTEEEPPVKASSRKTGKQPATNEFQRMWHHATYWGSQQPPARSTPMMKTPYLRALQTLRTRFGHGFVFMKQCRTKALHKLHHDTPQQAWEWLVYRKYTAWHWNAMGRLLAERKEDRGYHGMSAPPASRLDAARGSRRRPQA